LLKNKNLAINKKSDDKIVNKTNNFFYDKLVNKIKDLYSLTTIYILDKINEIKR